MSKRCRFTVPELVCTPLSPRNTPGVGSSRPRDPSTGKTKQAGFTIVELLVAMVIFSVGALALVGTSAHVVTTLASAQARTVAASVAANRFERMRAVSCASHHTDSAVTRGINERWTVVPLSRSDDVTVVLRFSADRATKSQVYRTFLPCT
jgi:type IV pilus modification protein PilV